MEAEEESRRGRIHMRAPSEHNPFSNMQSKADSDAQIDIAVCPGYGTRAAGLIHISGNRGSESESGIRTNVAVGIAFAKLNAQCHGAARDSTLQ